MNEVFLSILNMSLTACYVILFVMLVRLLLKKAPKFISYALWGVVAFRLLIPFSFESMFSLMPRNTNVVPIPHDIIYQQSPQINSGIKIVDSFVSQSLPAPTVWASVNPLQIYVEIGAYIWVLGIIAMLVYSIVSILILKKKLQSAQLIEKNIFEAKNLNTPFVLGLIKPKIYLPVGLKATERSYILLHEQTHIYRKDHIIKVLAFLILSTHWFNPLVWIAFRLMSIDMELSCDERVLKEIHEDIKKPYASSLLSLATGRFILNGSPLAFGEGNVRARIKNVLNYKKPTFWVIAVALVAAIVVAIGLFTNPITAAKPDDNSLTSQFLKNKIEYVGDNSKVGGTSTIGENEDIKKLVEDNLSVILSSPKESSNPQDYINAHKNEYENFFKYGGEDALQYMLSQFEAGNAQGLRGQVMMVVCKEFLGVRNNIADETLTPQEWYDALDIRQEIMLPDYEYDGQDTIEKLVYDTEIERDSTSNKSGGFIIVAPKIFGNYEEDDLIKVFVTTYSARYKLYGNTLSQEGGSIIPAAITYRKDDNGKYVLEKYEQAQDGSYFGSSIREYCTMPVSKKEIKGLADNIFKHYGDYEDIHILMYDNLFKHLKKNGIKDATLTNSQGEVEFSMSDWKYKP